MSVKKEIYLATSGKINELKETAKAGSSSTFKTIDLWKAQVGAGGNDKDSVVYPAAFVSIANIAWEDMTLNIQEGTARVSIYLFFSRHGDTFVGAKDLLDSLKILDIIQQVVEKIQWVYKDNFFTELTQTGDQDVTDRYKRPACILTFEAQAYNKLKLPNYVHN